MSGEARSAKNEVHDVMRLLSSVVSGREERSLPMETSVEEMTPVLTFCYQSWRIRLGLLGRACTENILVAKQQAAHAGTYGQDPDKQAWRHQRALVYLVLSDLRVVMAVAAVPVGRIGRKVVAGAGNQWLGCGVVHAV